MCVCMYIITLCVYIYINNNKNRDDNTNDDKHSNSNPNKKSNNIIYSIIFIYLHIMKICFHSLIYHSYFPADPPGIPGGGMPGGMPGIPGGTMPLRFAFSDLSKAKKNYWGVEQTTDYFWGVDLLIFFWSMMFFFPKASPMLRFSFSLLCRGGSDTEAWTGWTDGKPWEVAWGELRWEGATRKRGHGGRTGNRGK